MAVKVLEKSKIRSFLNKIAQTTTLIAPIEEKGTTVYAAVKSGEQVLLDFGNSRKPPKEHFFPQTEKMFTFEKGKENLEIYEVAPVDERVLFGGRPCDLTSLEMLDKVFLSGTFTDTYYGERREKTTIIGLACSNPAPTCFCTSFGISPGSTRGSDLMFYEAGDQYYVETVSDKGEKLVAKYSEFFRDGSAGELVGIKKSYEEKELPLAKQTDVTGIREKLDGMFEHPYWEEVSKKCLSCGACTYVCPTCYCFGTTDVLRGTHGVRYRVWDSCKFQDFSKMAGGHNPRPTKKERTRQRFMHKLNYNMHRNNEYLCVGCGRCVEVCPVGLHIAGVISDVRGA